MNFWDLSLLVIALLGGGLYSGLETGVVSINRLRLHHLVRRKVKGAAIIQRFVDEPDDLLGTTLVGTNVCNVIVSVTSASLAMAWLGAAGAWVAGVGSSLAVLVFSEYLPKAWFRSLPAYRTIPFANWLLWSFRVFYPISRGVTALTRLVVPTSPEGQSGFITREELEFMTREGENTGTLSPHERRMMHGVFELTRKAVEEVMVPRSEMAILTADMPADEALAVAREKKFSRFPVWDKQDNRFMGVLHVFDLLTARRTEGTVVRDYVRPPQYISAREAADKLFPRMRITRRPMALVTDARSEVVGLVTIEDLLRQIVGQM